MRRLHRRNYAEFGKPREVGEIDNLRVLNPPPGLPNFSLLGWNGFERLFIEIEDHPVRPIANRVCLDLNTAAQRFFEHRSQFLRFFREITRSAGRVAVWFQQRRAARTECAVENDFDRALAEMVIVSVDCWSFAQESLRVFTRTINGVDKA